MKRKRSSHDSTELFLDTVCNAFGGILFIALLLALIVPRSEARWIRPDHIDAAAREVNSLRQELERLQEEGKRLREQLASMKSSSGEQLETRIAEEQRRHARLVKSMRELSKKAHAALDRLAAQRRALDEAQREQRRLEREIEAAERRLKRLQQSGEVRSVALPRAVRSRQNVASFMLRNGRLINTRALPRHNSRYEVLGLSQEVEVVRSRDGSRIIRPRPGAGIAMARDPSVVAKVTALFERYDPAVYCIQVWVWPDSFEYWPSVREALLRSGHRYALEPVEAGTEITIGNPPPPLVQ